MNSSEKSLQTISLLAIIILSVVSIDLLTDKERDAETIYVVIDNRNQIENNSTIEILNRSDVARIASFNIKVFGDTKMSNETIVSELVTIFDRYDLVAVQEIKDIDQEVPYLFLDELNGNLTNSSFEWRLLLSQRTGIQEDDQNSQEQYAYYYKSNVFSAVGNGTLYDDSGNDSFQREPFLGKFNLLDSEGNHTDTEIVLINIHTKPTLAVEEMNALDEVIAWARNYFPDENDFIILGDFNADCSYASYNEIVNLPISSENYTWLIPDDADTTMSDSRCAYDRIVTTSDIEGKLTGTWGVDENISGPEVSDHKPIWFDIIR